MKHTMKHILAWLLVAVMALGLLPVQAAHADEWEHDFTGGSGCTLNDGGAHHYSLFDSTDATCTAGGSAHYECRCGASVDKTSNPLGHKWGEWKTLREPGCETKGEQWRVCGRCKAEEHADLAPLGHNWTESKVTKEPTCTEKGSRTDYCYREPTVVHTRTVELDALGHDWDSGKVTKQPTATEPGVRTYTCKRDPSHTKTESIPATGGQTSTEPKPAISYVITWEEGAGIGKRYVGAQLLTHHERKNIGNCPLRVHLPDNIMDRAFNVSSPADPDGLDRVILQPGESFSYDQLETVDSWDVGCGAHRYASNCHANYQLPNDEWWKGQIWLTDNGGKHAEVDIPLTYPDDLDQYPGLSLSVTCADGEGKGKRYEGAKLLTHWTVRNTGAKTLTVPITDGFNIVGPNGAIASPGDVVLQPNETVTLDEYVEVMDIHVQEGEYKTLFVQSGWYEENGVKHQALAADLLTVPLTDEEPIYALSQVVIQTSPVKEVYPHDGGDWNKAEEIYYDQVVTNIGNRPMFVMRYREYESSGYVALGRVLQPGESWTFSDYYVLAATELMTPDPADSPYAGTVNLLTWAEGYDIEEAKNSFDPPVLCKTETITLSAKIAKPGEEIGDEAYMTLEKRLFSNSSDPNGFQLGEEIQYWWGIITQQRETPHPFTDIVVYDEFALEGNGGNVENGVFVIRDYTPPVKFGITQLQSWQLLYLKHTVTQEDVDRGYFDNYCYMTYKNKETGKEYLVYSNTVRVPVISNPTLPMAQKVETSTPQNTGYYTAGEQVTYSVTVKNNTKETFTDVEIKDAGMVIGTIASLAPGQSSEAFAAPTYTVTAYDELIGSVTNVATVTAQNGKGETVQFSSNPVTVSTKPKTGENGDPFDPIGGITGKQAALSIVKAETSTPGEDGFYHEGETIDYAITVTDTGSETVDSAVIRDSLEQANLGVIASIGPLAPGESVTIPYHHTVTAADVAHGVVVNVATASWVAGGSSCVPVQSNQVISYTGMEGLLNPHDGGFDVPPYDPNETDENGNPLACRLEIDAVGSSSAQYRLTHCGEHAKVSERAAGMDAEGAIMQWRMAIDLEYQKLYELAWGSAAAAVLLEHDQFDLFYANFEAMLLAAADKSAAQQRLCTFLELYLAELCCARHTADNALPDSLLRSYTALAGDEATKRCQSALLDGVYTERYGERHATIFQTLRADLKGVQNGQSAARAFETGTALWRMALDTDAGALFNSVPAARTSVAAMRIALDTFTEGRGDCFAMLYPNDEEIAAENVLKYYRLVELALCELSEIPENPSNGWAKPMTGEIPDPTEPTEPTDPSAPEKAGLPKWLLPVCIGGGAALLVILGAFAAIVLMKKKRK